MTDIIRVILIEVHLDLICFLFILFQLKKKVLATQRHTWDLSSLTRDQTFIPCTGRPES